MTFELMLQIIGQGIMVLVIIDTLLILTSISGFIIFMILYTMFDVFKEK